MIDTFPLLIDLHRIHQGIYHNTFWICWMLFGRWIQVDIPLRRIGQRVFGQWLVHGPFFSSFCRRACVWGPIGLKWCAFQFCRIAWPKIHAIWRTWINIPLLTMLAPRRIPLFHYAENCPVRRFRVKCD